MKNQLFIGAIAITGLFTACNNAPAGEKAAVTDAQATDTTKTAAAAETGGFKVDAAASTVKWEGSKVGGKHTGDFKVKEGSLVVADGNITGGSFVIDMTTLNNTDLKGEEKTKLEGHLKSPDFFDVAKFGSAKFEITKVEKVEKPAAGKPTHTVTGNLTLKDVTKSVTMGANLTADATSAKADAPQFVINRTDWGVKYGSKTLAGAAKDKIINDEVGISIHLEARK